MEEDFGEDEGTMNAINYKDSIQGFGGNGDINAVNTDDLSDQFPGMYSGSLNPYHTNWTFDTVNTNPSSDSDMPGMNGGALNPVPVTTYANAKEACGYTWSQWRKASRTTKKACRAKFMASKSFF